MPHPTRRQLLRGGVAAGGAAAALATAATASGATTSAATTGAAATPAAVTDRLQRLMRIELLQRFCYQHVLVSPVLSEHARRTLSPFVPQETAHIAALERRLRARGAGVPVAPASVREANGYLAHRQIGGRLGQLKGDPDACRLLLTLEQVTIGAYTVALQSLTDPALIELCLQIMGTEAQHDAVLGLLMPKATVGSAAPYGLVAGLH